MRGAVLEQDVLAPVLGYHAPQHGAALEHGPQFFLHHAVAGLAGGHGQHLDARTVVHGPSQAGIEQQRLAYLQGTADHHLTHTGARIGVHGTAQEGRYIQPQRAAAVDAVLHRSGTCWPIARRSAFHAGQTPGVRPHKTGSSRILLTRRVRIRAVVSFVDHKLPLAAPGIHPDLRGLHPPLHQLAQPADHPINIYHPEGEYLKGLVLYVE